MIIHRAQNSFCSITHVSSLPVNSFLCTSNKSAESLSTLASLGPRLCKTRRFCSTGKSSSSDLNFKHPYLHCLCLSGLISQTHLCIHKQFTLRVRSIQSLLISGTANWWLNVLHPRHSWAWRFDLNFKHYWSLVVFFKQNKQTKKSEINTWYKESSPAIFWGRWKKKSREPRRRNKETAHAPHTSYCFQLPCNSGLNTSVTTTGVANEHRSKRLVFKEKSADSSEEQNEFKTFLTWTYVPPKVIWGLLRW